MMDETRLTRPSVLAPAPRPVGPRPIRWSLLALPVLALSLVLAVREVARVETLLASEGSRAQRVVVYEVRPGSDLRLPIEAGTEVFRVVAHAMRKGALDEGPHAARLRVVATGASGPRTEEVPLLVPGEKTRVTPEDPSLAIGDPVALDVDVHGVGRGELRIVVDQLADADALLLRVYRREVLGAEKAADRPEHLGDPGRARLAHLAGEVDWSEIDGDEQALLLSARWRRVAALPRENQGLLTHAIVLASRPRDDKQDPDPVLATWDVRGDERVAIMAHGRNVIRGRAEGDPEARVLATVRHLDGRVDTFEGKGEVRVDVPLDYAVGIELWRSSTGPLSVRASDPPRVEPAARVAAFRATRARPVVVKAEGEALVLRVATRRAVPRDAGEAFGIVLDATIVPARGPGSTTTLRARRARSLFDRYDVRAPVAAPTTSAVFHLIVPAHGVLTLTPADEPIDVSLAELDPEAGPRPVPSHPANQPWPKVEALGGAAWGGWVARRPSNAAALEEGGRVVLRVPHRVVEVREPEPKAPSFRVRRPDTATPLVVDGRLFEPTSVRFEIELRKGEPLVLPVRLFAREPLEVFARIDDGAFARVERGVAERVTNDRSHRVAGEVRSTVVLGDDLPPGKHVLSFTAAAGKEAWVHLPWLPRPRLPGAPPPDPHWIEGDLED